MKTFDVIKDAVGNTRRNKMRTGLTSIAVFIGAFTLTLTSSIGAGVSTYIDDQLGQLGGSNVITVTKVVEEQPQADDGLPQRYEKQPLVQDNPFPSSGNGAVLVDSDLTTIQGIEGIEKVTPVVFISPTYIESSNGEQWVISVNTASSVLTPDLAAGEPYSNEGSNPEVIIPLNYVEAFGFNSNEEAIGQQVTIGINDYLLQEHALEATITGVSNNSLFGDGIAMNDTAIMQLYDTSREGIPTEMNEKAYMAVMVTLPVDATQSQIDAVKTALADQGYSGMTVADQLGTIQAIISGIVGVLNGFAVIALIAAGFGIVNTLLMSVQERTREIGLMKAMGMPSRKIYTLFSAEAIILGVIGTTAGVIGAMLVGWGINTVLAGTLLADLPGLTISLFTVSNVGIVFLIVIAIAFLAGTIPASRAAKQDPIEALRYE